MSTKDRDPDRREFLERGAAAAVGLGLGASGVGPDDSSVRTGGRHRSTTPSPVAGNSQQAGGPLVLTSHTNDTGREAMRRAWSILSDGGRALDAVEEGANVIEVDPEDRSVGVGGLPNAEGVVQLDACIMDGRTYSAGAVGALEGIPTPSSVARLVMERTDHIFLVGRGALDFARSFGFEERELLTEESRRIWLRWREEHGPGDDWGPPDHLRGTDRAPELGDSLGRGAHADPGPGDARSGDGPSGFAGAEPSVEFTYGTTNVLALDSNGDLAGVTTTSGLSWKVPGRVGDSPIIGAGLYVDNEVGAAGATGRGEDVIKSCASHYIVMRMRDGRSPQEACEDAVELIAERYRGMGLDFLPGEKFVALNKAGEYGCVRMVSTVPGRMTVNRGNGPEEFEGSLLYPSRP